MRRLRIINTGSSIDTRILDADSGEDLTAVLMVRRIRWEHQAGELPVAILECLLADLDAVAAEYHLVPATATT